MAMDAKDIQERIDGGFSGGPHVRNINIDTHIGAAPQRPFAMLEDQMAMVSGGHASLKDLQASLKGVEVVGLPPGTPNPNEIKEDGAGYYRVVASQEPHEFVTVNGVLKERVRYEKRRVAATMAGARAASEAGTKTDFWNGFTWLREGYKPEQDFQTILQTQQRGADEELVFDVDPSPTNVSRVQYEMGNLAASRPPFPAETSRSSAKSKEDK